jgi:hypothetical protein
LVYCVKKNLATLITGCKFFRQLSAKFAKIDDGQLRVQKKAIPECTGKNTKATQVLDYGADVIKIALE